jgi:GYF domain 2
MTSWYLWDGGEPQGPMDDAELNRRLRAHENPGLVMVWRQGFSGWQPAVEVLGLGGRDATPPPLPPEAVAAPEPPKSQNFVARHWRGEYRLWVSYWVVGIASNLAALLAITLLSQLMVTQVAYVPLALWTFFVALWSGLVGLAVWQAVGIWRSATRRRIERHAAGKRAFWPVMAKIAVCLGGLQLGGVLFKAAIPQIAEATRMAFLGDPSIPSYTIRALNNGTEAEISGGIKYGLARDFEQLLDGNSGIRVVHLDSLGGRIGEGKRLNALIRARNLDTYVETKCMSACTLAFAAGKQRVLRRGAVLGFHRGAFPGSQPEETTSGVEREIYAAAGFSKAFIDRALATKNSDMWKPGEAELLSYRVVTKVSGGGEYAMGGAPLSRDDWDKSLMKSAPVYSAIKQKYPDDYDRILDIFSAGAARGAPVGEMTRAGQEKLRAIIMALLPQADDAVLIEFARLRTDEYRALQTRDVVACYKFVSGVSLDESVIKQLPAELATRELSLHEQIVRTATAREKAGNTEESAKALWSTIKGNLARKGFSSADLQALALPDEPASPTRYCATAVELFGEIIRLPGKDAALVFRDMYGADK